MSNDSQNVQAIEFDSKIEELDKKIERSEKTLMQWKSDRDALIRAKALICGNNNTSEDKKDEERGVIADVLAEHGVLHYKEIAAKVNAVLGKSKSEGAYYTKLDRLSKGDEPTFQNVGGGKFTLTNKNEDETKEGASSQESVEPSSPSRSDDAAF